MDQNGVGETRQKASEPFISGKRRTKRERQKKVQAANPKKKKMPQSQPIPNLDAAIVVPKENRNGPMITKTFKAIFSKSKFKDGQN